MKLSKRGEYGLRALQDLAAHYGNNPVSNKELAERNNIPLKFLEQIMLILKHGRIVNSQKGPVGGYTLARPPEQITLAEVIRLLDGPLAPIPCVSATAFEPCGCPDMEKCGLRRVMKEVRDVVAGMMENTTLADLVMRNE
ncbi:MAG TPA: Rrf2 family transcriptional regulator [Anaerolineae bacterium]|nr:Rrf2 family transcriptional regulator [Anaerolineae bacterium]HQK14910.1 Rrf2 family transcriptional regulator [Anaerolineae bacterium]